MSRPPLDVVCDAGPLIHLDEVGCLDLLTDDAAARLAAKGQGYRVHGSIGILLRAVRRQQRTAQEALSILRDLASRSTLYVRPDLLTEITAQVESEIVEISRSKRPG